MDASCVKFHTWVGKIYSPRLTLTLQRIKKQTLPGLGKIRWFQSLIQPMKSRWGEWGGHVFTVFAVTQPWNNFRKTFIYKATEKFNAGLEWRFSMYVFCSDYNNKLKMVQWRLYVYPSAEGGWKEFSDSNEDSRQTDATRKMVCVLLREKPAKLPWRTK